MTDIQPVFLRNAFRILQLASIALADTTSEDALLGPRVGREAVHLYLT